MDRIRFAAIALALALVTQRASAQLVTNGGFEAGNLSGWTLTGSSCFTGVNSLEEHTGSFGLYSGPIGGTCTVSQSFATTAGAQYTFSFWIMNNSSGTPNSFDARWDGGSVYSVTNSPQFAYTQQMFTVTASAPTATIDFVFRHNPSYWSLDDVSVERNGVDGLSTVPEPSTYLLMASGLLGLAIARRRRRA